MTVTEFKEKLEQLEQQGKGQYEVVCCGEYVVENLSCVDDKHHRVDFNGYVVG